jgi:hypothetical protein
MIFSISDFIMDQISPDGNKEQSFAPLFLNGRNKKHGCMTEYHPIQQTSGIDALLQSPVEPSETLHSGQIKKGRHQKDLHLHTRETLGLARRGEEDPRAAEPALSKLRRQANSPMAPTPQKLCNASTPWSRASTMRHRTGAAHRHVVSLQMKRATTATHRRPKQAQDGHIPSMPALHGKTDWIAPPRAIATSALLAQPCRNSSPSTRTTSCISAPKHNTRTPHLPFPIGKTGAATIAGACGGINRGQGDRGRELAWLGF